MFPLNQCVSTLVIIVTSFVWDTWACTCFPTHAQQQFCRADMVFVAKIKDVEEIFQNSLVKTPNMNDPLNPYARMPVERKYKVRIHRFFKGEELLNNIGKSLKYIHMPGSGAACGIKLTMDKTYIITARIDRGEVWTSMCNWIQDYKEIKRHQLKGLKFHYKRNCQCEVNFCWEEYCGSPKSRECLWDVRSQNTCFHDHGFCMINNENKCEWKRNRQLKECLRNNNIVFPWKTIRKPPTENTPDSGNKSPGENSPGLGLSPDEYNPGFEGDNSPGYGAHSPGYNSPGYNSPGFNSPGYGQENSPREPVRLPEGFIEP